MQYISNIVEFQRNSYLRQAIGHSGSISNTRSDIKWLNNLLRKWVSPTFCIIICLVCVGEAVRIQPNRITFNNIKAMDDIYGHSTKTNKNHLYNVLFTSDKYPLTVVSEMYLLHIFHLNDSNKKRHASLRQV